MPTLVIVTVEEQTRKGRNRTLASQVILEIPVRTFDQEKHETADAISWAQKLVKAAAKLK